MAEVPNLIKLRQIPVDYAQKLDTDLLETSTFSEATAAKGGFARFDIQPKGFLHSQSKLFLSCVPPAGACSFPLNVGVGTLIDRAVLKVGNQVLNEISDWSHFQTLRSAQIDNEAQVEREHYLTGRCINHKWIYQQDAAGTAALDTHRAPFYGLDTGRDYSPNAAGDEGLDLLSMPVAQLLAAAPTESPVYSISMDDLFPFLKVHSLPLYMIKEPLYIELHLSKTGVRVVSPVGVAAQNVLLDTSETKFAADYIFYTDGDVMTRYAEANKDLEFTFPDYRLSKRSVSNVELASGVVANIGMANRLVSRVFTTITDDTRTQVSILGKYEMEAPQKVVGSTNNSSGAIEYNVRYNDRFEFPISIDNKARAFSHFIQSDGPLFVTREEYSNDQQGITSAGFDGHAQNGGPGADGIAGKSFVLGTKLTSGRVGTRGIEVHLKALDYRAGTFVMRSYSEYMRLAKLSDGRFSIFNA